MIIPHTQRRTTLFDLVVGGSVNLEVDLLARYAARLLRGPPIPRRTPPITTSLSSALLRTGGFLVDHGA